MYLLIKISYESTHGVWTSGETQVRHWEAVEKRMTVREYDSVRTKG